MCARHDIRSRSSARRHAIHGKDVPGFPSFRILRITMSPYFRFVQCVNLARGTPSRRDHSRKSAIVRRSAHCRHVFGTQNVDTEQTIYMVFHASFFSKPKRNADRFASRRSSQQKGQDGKNVRRIVRFEVCRVEIEWRGCEQSENETGEREYVGDRHAFVSEGSRSDRDGPIQRGEGWESLVSMRQGPSGCPKLNRS